jgi:hypothetical protein
MTPTAVASGGGGVRAELRLRCRDSAEAERLRRSLAPDDAAQARLGVEGATLLIDASSPAALGLLRTLDDLLGCLRAAEPDL